MSYAETQFLAFHAAHVLTQSGLFQPGIAGQFGQVADRKPDKENGEHDREHGTGLTAHTPASCLAALFAAVTHHQAEHHDKGTGKQHHGKHFQHAGKHRGVFQRRRGIGPQETAPVGAQVLDADQGGYGAHGDILIFAFDGLHGHIGGEVLGAALPHQHEGNDDGQREQHTGNVAYQIPVEVAQAHPLIGQAAHKGHDHCAPRGGRGEHHVNDDHHLAQVGQAGLARIMLEVGVCHETDDGVERQTGFHAPDAVGIEEGDELDTQDQIANKDHRCVGSHQGQHILLPVHVTVIYTADAVDDAVKPVEKRVTKCLLIGGDVIKIFPCRKNHDHKDSQKQCDLKHRSCPLGFKIFPDWPVHTSGTAPRPESEFQAAAWCAPIPCFLGRHTRQPALRPEENRRSVFLS